jgi:cytochrome b561
VGGSHTFLAKFVHWFFVILYAYGIFKQLDDLEQLEDSGLLVFEVVFASVFLLIVLIRYFYMSRFETFLGANEPVPLIHKYLAKTVHRLMYFCLVLLPLTGLAIAALFRRGMVDGLLMDGAIGVHGFAAGLSYLLIAVHVLAAVYSRLKNEGIWTSMVPLWKEDATKKSDLAEKITVFEGNVLQKVEALLPAKNNEGAQ